MRVTYWGVTGSIPAPLKPQEVRRKAEVLIENLTKAGGTDKLLRDGRLDPELLKLFLDQQPMEVVGTYRGNTTCIEIQARDSPLVIIDGGSGLREFGLKLMGRLMKDKKLNPLSIDERTSNQLHLIFTHVHWDHIQGFPFFIPLFLRETDLHLYARAGSNDPRDRDHREALEDVLRGQQQYPTFPVRLHDLPCKADYNHPIGRMRPARIEIGNLRIMPQELTHPDGAFGYRIDVVSENLAFVMASDTEHKAIVDPRLVALAKGARILYYDAQYTPEEYPGKIDWGHSTYEWAIRTALEAGVEIVVLGHHEPTHDDFDLAKIFQRALGFRDKLVGRGKYRGRKLEVVMGYEGLTQELG